MPTVNLSSLSFFRRLRVDARQFAIIGLGRFGRAVCSTLHNAGYDVLAIDRDEKKVNQVLHDEIASHALQLDATDSTSLRESGIIEFDTAIVAIGRFVEESVIATLNLKEAGVPYVVSKASSDIHMKLLQRVGADHVVFPERQMGYELGRALIKPGVLDWLELDPDHSVVELLVPERFDGKTIAELELRKCYGLNVLAISHGEKFEINPPPHKHLEKGEALVVIGADKDIERFSKGG